ncbi:MAG: RNA polymerase sigma-70 factor [Cytophagales bacterium]|nr:RNA polymerase sigma-70 factor [Cytophagales bacterium]
MAETNLNTFERLFRTHYEELVRHALQFLNSLEEAEDLVQEAFVKLWDRKHELGEVQNVRAYLFRMVRNMALNVLKSKYRSIMHEELDEAHSQVLPDAPELRDLEVLSERIVGQLPEKTRLIFKLSRFSNLSYAEIAEEMQLSVKSVEYHMSKAIHWIKKNLSKHWYLVWLLVGF